MVKVLAFLKDTDGTYRRDMIFLMVFFGLFFFLYLGHLPLLEPDEGRYAEIPREMLERGDFITPYLNYVKYFEKPPLHYWLNSLSFSLLGLNEFAARFHSALLGLAGVVTVYHAGRVLFGRREGLYSAIVLGSSIGYLAQARMNIIDMTLTFCMTATLITFLLATRETGTRKGICYHLFYVFAALAVLAKGLIGIVLPGCVVFLYILITRQWRLFREMRLATGIPLFLAVCAPWFILVSWKNPEFARFFFIHEHFERFLTKVHGRYQPPWYFIPVLMAGMAPWIFFLPEAIGELWKKRDDRKIFFLIWAAVIFGFFSASSSKLIPYILPVFPALAMLLGVTLSEQLERSRKSLYASYAFAAMFLFIVAAGFFLYPQVVAKARIPMGSASVIAGIFLAGGIFSIIALLRKHPAAMIGIIMVTTSVAAIVAPPIIFARSIEKKSSRELARMLRGIYPHTQLVSYLRYRQDLTFYTGRRTILAGPRGELEFGSRQDKQSGWFLDEREFAQRWNSSDQIIALVSKADLEKFRSSVGDPVRNIATWGETLLISNL